MKLKSYRAPRSKAAPKPGQIERAEMSAGIAQQRKQEEEVLRESEATLRATFEQAKLGIHMTAVDGRFLQVNEKYCDMVGYTREELLRMNVAEVNFPQHKSEAPDLRKKVLAGEMNSFSLEKQLRRRDGSPVWATITISAVRGPDNAVQHFISVVEDISERKEAEQALRGSEERFRATFDNAPVGIMHTSIDGDRILHTNPKLSEMLGYTRDELLSMSADDFVHPEIVGEDRPKYREQMLRGEMNAFSSERRYVRKDGSILWVNRTVSLARDAAGRPLYFIRIVEDITERTLSARRRAMEHAVTQVLAESATAEEAMPIILRTICQALGWTCGAYWKWNKTEELLRCDETWHVDAEGVADFVAATRESPNEAPAWHGAAPGTSTGGVVRRVWFSGAPAWFPDVMQQPDFRRGPVAARAGLRSAFAFPILAGTQPLGVMEFYGSDIKRPDETLLQMVWAVGSQIGQFLQRKQAEEVLRESEARFRSLTALSSDVYWEQDDRYCFTSFSGTGSELVNPANLQWIGKKRWEQNYINMSASDWAAHIALLDARQPFRDLELCRMNEAGERTWIRVSGEPVFDASGAFKGYHGVGRDITTRKRGDQLQALEHAVTRGLANADSGSTALSAVLSAVCETEGWECGRYFTADHKAGVLRFSAAWGVPDEEIEHFIAQTRDVTYAPGVGLAGRVWQSGQPLWVADIDKDARVSPGGRARESGIHGAFVFPVISDGKTIGVLIFNSRKVREPDERLLQSVRVIGSQIGQFLQRKQAEERTRDQALQQRLIAEFGRQALASTELAQVLDRAAELVSDTLKVDYSNVLQLDPGGQQLIYRAAVGWPQEWIGRRSVPIEPGSRLEHILSRGEPLVIEDYNAETQFSTSPLAKLGIRSGVQLPIFGSKGTYGVLCAHTQRARQFTDDDVSFLRNVASILAIAIERKNAEDKLAHLAQFDTITGLPNRYLFRDRLGQILSQAQRNSWKVGVLFVDLDRFKAVNDTYGHGVGDELLRQVATRIKESVRGSDTVGRWSGDEFAVALADLAKAEDAGLVAQKIVTALAAPFMLDGHQVYVSASIGIALFPGDGGEPETLIKNADTAMYRGKEQGRNCYQFYLPQMNERLMQRLNLETRLRGALERKEFVLHYQPKVSLDTGAITGFEALLRWRQGDKLVSPAEFIPVLEETGLIVPVGEWVLRSACDQLKRWEEQGVAARPVAVNLSARQFQQKNLAAVVGRILQETGVVPDLIELELTETLLMSDAEEAVQTLRALKSLGVRLAVDDFGTGYSSLAYLRRFPLDSIKIDRAFIKDAVSNADDAVIAQTIISLGHGLKLKVVAEGVETAAQLDFLSSRGCDEMQGYYFARPQPVDDCTRALIEDRRLSRTQGEITPDLPVLLLVDDNEDDLRLLERTFAAGGFRVVTANGPTAGLSLLARYGAAVVVSDQRMPEMTGIEFLRQVRKHYPDTVRVVTSSASDVDTLTEAINDAGIHKFLSKDWHPDRLRAEVREAYQRRR